MEKSKPKPNPKKLKDEKRKRKVSLPTCKSQSRLCIEELKQNFKRQISLPKERDIIPLYDPTEKAHESASLIREKTGVIFDETTNDHICLWDKNYPENPERLNCILKRCKELDLFSECEILFSVPATVEEIKTVHTQSHYNLLQQTQFEKDIEELKKLSSKYDAIYINEKTFDAALKSAGCCLQLTKAVLEGKVSNGMALVRPPGHHAMSDEYCGYCFINNAALAAQCALKKMKRVLIIDWDIHHGQGTQQTFYDDPRVLYFSSHRYEWGRFWPHLRESDFDHCGAGAGLGTTLNIPLNETGMGNAEFLAFFHQVLLPVAYEFSPEVVFISCGYDAALGCPEGMMQVTPALFAHLTSTLMPLASGKVIVLLEGGYCLESLAESAIHTLKTLMGHPCPRLLDRVVAPSQSACESILSAISVHRRFWKSICFQGMHEDNSLSSPNCIWSSGEDSADKPLPRFNPKAVFKGPPAPAPGTLFPIANCYPEYPESEREKCMRQLQRLKEGTSMGKAPVKLCFVYDSDMAKHFNSVEKSYPERPARIRDIFKKLTEFGILDRVLRVPSRRAMRSELRLAHSDKMIDVIQGLASLTPSKRNSLATDYNSIYFNEHTWDSARLSAGCLLQVVDAVCTHQAQSGFALIRPPGHHAEEREPHGFCIFNNVCVAAKYAMKKFSLKRILIVDWDVHHGNGIQHCFESSSAVLYISIHVYKGGNFFPYSKDADSNYIGKGSGRGYNINIPWSKSGMGDADYISAFTQLVLPVSYQFDPELILVSAGFDAAVNDPLGGCCVTPECFGHLTHLLSALANGNIILALEGGYNLASISYCAAMCAKALLGDPLPPLNQGLAPSPSALKDISRVITIHKAFWSCFQFQVSLPMGESTRPASQTRSTLEDKSDVEFLTPPQSPSEVATRTDAAIGTGATDEAKAPESLVSLFSEMVLNDTTAGVTFEPGLAAEGAVGSTSLTELTIAQMLQEDSQFHAVVPLSWCPHLGEVNPVPNEGIDVKAKCQVCHDRSENWQCLTCYNVFCGRYVREHMLEHGLKDKHNMVLSFSDLSVWCYACESYIDNKILETAKQSAYQSKFGHEMVR